MAPQPPPKTSPELVERLRNVLAFRPGISEKRMFGGLFFMLGGNMFCCVSKHGYMFRVGPEREQEALLRPGARAQDVTGRPLPGFIIVEPEAAIETGLGSWVDFAAEYVGALRPK